MRTSLLILLAVITGAGCLQSPLLNHLNAAPRETEVLDTAIGCALHFEKAGLCATLSWERLPADEETGELTLRFWNPKLGTEAGPFVDPGFGVTVKLWMPAMGHGSSPVRVSQAATGVFSGREVYFSMPGQWEIWVQLRSTDRQVQDQAKIDFRVK